MTTRRNTSVIWMVLIALLGATLRLHQLEDGALWFDEGVSLTFAELPVRDLAYYHVLWVDVNPPAYRALLGLWTDIAGSSVLAARLFSAWLGVAAIPLTYWIGRSLRLGRGTALAGALILAVAPMQVYYSREAKGYTLIQLAVLGSIVIWLRLFSGNHPLNSRRAAGLGGGLFAATALAVGSHYVAGLMVIVAGLWTLGWALSSRRHGAGWSAILPREWLWFSAQGVGCLVWMPWVIATARGAAEGTRTAAENIGLQARTPVQYLAEMLGEFGGGPADVTLLYSAAAVILAVFAAVGLVKLRRKQQRWWLLGIWWMGPVVLGFVVQAIMPFFYPRFLMYVTPAMALLAGHGVMSLTLPPEQLQAELARRSKAFAVCLFIAILTAQSVGAITARAAELDIRPLADALAGQVKQDDAVIYSYSWQPGMLTAYLPADRVPAMYASFFEQGTRDESMQDILYRHGRVWLLTYRISADDPINDIGNWLLSHAATPGGVWYGDSQLSLFIAPDRIDNAGSPTDCHTFGGQRIELCAAPLNIQRLDEADPISVALEWTARQPLVERYIVFVHLLAEGNPVPVAQQDSQPVNNLRPTYTWTPGETILDLHAIEISPEVRQEGGTLTVVAGLYDADTLERVPVDGGTDLVVIGHVSLTSR